MPAYKQKCYLCKENWAIVRYSRQKFVVCKECEMKSVKTAVKDPTMKKMFALPLDWYEENDFLRSIRYSYGKWGSLTEKQLAAFKKTVKELKEETKKKKDSK